METKYKTDRTERQSPAIGVAVHCDPTTDIAVEASSAGGIWMSIRGNGYPSVSVFMERAKLAEMGEVIAAYLEGTK